jgi:hypothetical protein
MRAQNTDLKKRVQKTEEKLNEIMKILKESCDTSLFSFFFNDLFTCSKITVSIIEYELSRLD